MFDCASSAANICGKLVAVTACNMCSAASSASARRSSMSGGNVLVALIGVCDWVGSVWVLGIVGSPVGYMLALYALHHMYNRFTTRCQ